MAEARQSHPKRTKRTCPPKGTGIGNAGAFRTSDTMPPAAMAPAAMANKWTGDFGQPKLSRPRSTRWREDVGGSTPMISSRVKERMMFQTKTASPNTAVAINMRSGNPAVCTGHRIAVAPASKSAELPRLCPISQAVFKLAGREAAYQIVLQVEKSNDAECDSEIDLQIPHLRVEYGLRPRMAGDVNGRTSGTDKKGERGKPEARFRKEVSFHQVVAHGSG